MTELRPEMTGWVAYAPGGYGTGQRVPGVFPYIVLAMKAARDGRPWFEAEAEGAKVEPANVE